MAYLDLVLFDEGDESEEAWAALLEELREGAWALLSRYWDAVERVAEAAR